MNQVIFVEDSLKKFEGVWSPVDTYECRDMSTRIYISRSNTDNALLKTARRVAPLKYVARCVIWYQTNSVLMVRMR